MLGVALTLCALYSLPFSTINVMRTREPTSYRPPTDQKPGPMTRPWLPASITV